MSSTLIDKLAGCYRGIVLDSNDPQGLHRVKVQVPDLLGLSDLGWAWPAIPNLVGQTPPNEQDPVWVIFEAGDIERPVYIGTWIATRPGGGSLQDNYVLSGGSNVYPSTASEFLGVQVNGDTFDRYATTASGTQYWGPGSAPADVSVGRLSASTLGLTGSLSITGALSAASLAVSGSISGGAVSASSVAVTGAISAASLSLTTPLPISSGGTGSATQNFVDLTTAQNIAGVKTFTSAPVVPVNSFPETAVTNLVTDLAARAIDSTVVHLAGTETITGTKTFSRIITGTAGIDSTGSPSGYDSEFRFPNLTNLTGGAGAALSTLYTGSPRMYFDHRGTSNTGDWYWRNGTSAATPQMYLTSVGILSLMQQPGTTHESNRVDGVAEVYGRGFAYATDSASHQGGVTSGLSITIGRTTPAASINNAGTGDIQQWWNAGSTRARLTYDGLFDFSLAAVTATQRSGAVRLPFSSSFQVVGSAAGSARFGQYGDGFVHITNNNYWDGTGWARDNAAIGSSQLSLTTTALRFWSAAAGAGYASFTEGIRYDAALNNGTLYVYGNDTYLGRGAFGAAAGRLHLGDRGTNDGYIVAETGTGGAASIHIQAQTAHLFEDPSGVVRFSIDSSGNLHQNNGSSSIYATFAEGVTGNAIRIGEVFGDGGLYKPSGHMHFDLGGVAGSQYKWTYQNSTRMTLTDTGNLILATGSFQGAKIKSNASGQVGAATYTGTSWIGVGSYVTFTKVASASSLLVTISTSWFANSAGSFLFGFGASTVGIPSAGTAWITGFLNTTGAHTVQTATFKTAMAAGTWFVRIMLNPSGGSFQSDTNDYFSITVEEVM